MRIYDVGAIIFCSLLTVCMLLAVGCAQHGWSWNPGRSMPFLDFDNSGGSAVAARYASPAFRPARADYSFDTGSHSEWNASGKRRWDYIVVHHSATSAGSASVFHRQHLAKGWDGLGYHFVIGNGRGVRDGRVQVGPRWRSQKHGAHCGGTPGNAYNEHGIGICLVGNFENQQPTAAQKKSLQELVSYLQGKYNISPANIIGHKDAPNASTKCCGRSLYRHVHRELKPTLSSYASRD